MDINYTAPKVREEVSFSYKPEFETRQDAFDILIPQGYEYKGEYSLVDPDGNIVTTVNMIREIYLSQYLLNLTQ